MRKLIPVLTLTFILFASHSYAQSDLIDKNDHSTTVKDFWGNGTSTTYENPEINIQGPGNTGGNTGGTTSSGGDHDTDDSGGIETPSSTDFEGDYHMEMFVEEERYLPTEVKPLPAGTLNTITEKKKSYTDNPPHKMSLRKSVPKNTILEAPLPPAVIASAAQIYVSRISGDIHLYLSSGKRGTFIQLMQNRFEALSGYSLPPLQNGLNPLFASRSIHEMNIINLYNEFLRQAIRLAEEELTITLREKEKAQLMGTISENCYEPGIVGQTGFSPMRPEDAAGNAALQQLLKVINTFNSDGSGFFAQLYRNPVSGEYVLAFRGSENPLTNSNDWLTNFANASGSLTTQYRDAQITGMLLRCCKINAVICGHSLGGGLAQVAALESGIETYTYNAAGVPVDVIQSLELSLKNQDKVTSYYSSSDILSFLQDLTPEQKAGILGGGSLIGDLSGHGITPEILKQLTQTELGPSALGKRIKLEDAGFHRMKDLQAKLDEATASAASAITEFRKETADPEQQYRQ